MDVIEIQVLIYSFSLLGRRVWFLDSFTCRYAWMDEWMDRSSMLRYRPRQVELARVPDRWGFPVLLTLFGVCGVFFAEN